MPWPISVTKSEKQTFLWGDSVCQTPARQVCISRLENLEKSPQSTGETNSKLNTRFTSVSRAIPRQSPPPSDRAYVQRFSSTCNATLLRWKLKNVAHITTYCDATKFRYWRRSSMLQQVELVSTFSNKFFQLATTKFVGATTLFKCCVANCSNLLLVLLHLKS